MIFVTREGYALAGARIRNYNFARELRKRGIKAEVLSYSEDLGAKDGINEGYMSLIDKNRHNIAAYKRLSKEKDAIIVIQRINYHSFAPFLNHIIGKNRVVLDIDDWEMRDDPRYLFGFYPTSKAEYLTRITAKRALFCVAASNFLKDFLSPFNKTVYYIPSCVDTKLFKPSFEHKKRNTFKFVWAGTLHRQEDVENVRFIIDCFLELKKEIRNMELNIIGDGIYSRYVRSYISEQGCADCVRFSGWIEPEEMPLCLEDMDAGLFPLIQKKKFNFSKSPTKLFEYMAMAKPTVSSRLGEAERVIDDGKDGFLAQDKDEFVRQMKILYNNRDLCKNMGEKARGKALRDYSLTKAGDMLEEAFNAET